VILAELLSKYLQSSLEAFFGFLEITQVSQDQSEVVDSYGHGGMIRSVDLLVDLQGFLQGGLCLIELTERSQVQADLIQQVLAGNPFPSKPIYVMNPHYCVLCKTIPSTNFYPWPRPQL